MSTRLKGAQESITLDMIPDFEPDEVEGAKLTAWSVLDAMQKGISSERACYLFRVTLEQVAPYKQEWEQNRQEWERVQSLEQHKITPA